MVEIKKKKCQPVLIVKKRKSVLNKKATITAEQLLETFAELTIEMVERTNDKDLIFIIHEIMRIAATIVTKEVMKNYGEPIDNNKPNNKKKGSKENE